jgi:hypothetical protein
MPIKSKLLNGGELITWDNGDQYYYLNGYSHREDGPAIEHANGHKFWFVNGTYIPCTTQEEFERLMKLKVFW